MLLASIVSSLHLLALAIGLPSVFMRARWLRSRPFDDEALRRVFIADNCWGIAAGLWLLTGLGRAFGGLEKGTAYYLHVRTFHLKLGLFILVVLLEAWPMISLIRWRLRRGRGEDFDTARANTFARISDVQTFVIIIMVFMASLMARGVGAIVTAPPGG